MSVVWHDLECGRYQEDLPLWRELAARYGSPVLDIGAGTGRVALDLARAGHPVTALDTDAELLGALKRRVGDLDVTVVQHDARRFALGRRFPLCIVPMQTVQLLGGATGRREFLACAHRHLEPEGCLAVALAEELDVFDVEAGAAAPLPDVCEEDGTVFSSQPTAVREDASGFVLERHRQTVTPDGKLSSEEDRIHLDRLGPEELEGEAETVGLHPAGRERVAQTSDYVGSVVVMLRA
jgi:SAM-dependent methyltransferase